MITSVKTLFTFTLNAPWGRLGDVEKGMRTIALRNGRLSLGALWNLKFRSSKSTYSEVSIVHHGGTWRGALQVPLNKDSSRLSSLRGEHEVGNFHRAGLARLSNLKHRSRVVLILEGGTSSHQGRPDFTNHPHTCRNLHRLADEVGSGWEVDHFSVHVLVDHILNSIGVISATISSCPSGYETEILIITPNNSN